MVYNMTSCSSQPNYNLEDFGRIINDGFHFELSTNVIDMISSISEKVGSVSYIKTPVFPKRSPRVRDDRKKERAPMTADTIEAIRNFKPTVIEKRQGVDGMIDTLRVYFNKISDKNYDSMKEKITNTITELKEETDAIETWAIVGSHIFEIASNNNFYSKLYAELYKYLMNSFPIFKRIFDENLDMYQELFENIEYVDADEDYDNHRRVSKINQKRRSMSLFMVHLMNLDVLDADKIMTIAKGLHNDMFLCLKAEECQEICQEVAENLQIMINNGHEKLIQHAHWVVLKDEIQTIRNYKVKDYPSLNNKLAFKYMDIWDKVKDLTRD